MGYNVLEHIMILTIFSMPNVYNSVTDAHINAISKDRVGFWHLPKDQFQIWINQRFIMGNGLEDCSQSSRRTSSYYCCSSMRETI